MSDEIKPIELLTSQQVADALGVKIDTVEKWRSKKRGPAFIRVGGYVRYRPSAIESYLQSQTESPSDAAV